MGTPAEGTDPPHGAPWKIEQLLKWSWHNKRKLYKIKWKGLSKTTRLYEEDIPPILVREYKITRTARGKVSKHKRRNTKQN